MQEKRLSERVIIKVPIELEILSLPADSNLTVGSTIHGVTENISSGGILMDDGIEKYGSGGLLVKIREYIPIGSMLKSHIIMPLPGFNTEIVLEATVLRCDKNIDLNQYMLAIKFTKIIKHFFTHVKLTQVKKMLGLQ